jgi:hypothetical protein
MTYLNAFEQRMNLIHGSSSSSSSSSANMVSRGHGNGRGNHGYGTRHGHRNVGPRRGRGGFNSGKHEVKCQLCKDGHSVVGCWYMFTRTLSSLRRRGSTR